MSASAEIAREQLFGDVLSCEEIHPAAFVPGPLDSSRLRGHAVQAEALLRALAVVEDGARSDESDPHVEGVFRRLEAKIDLLTALVAGFAAGHSTDPARPLRWSARGARMVTDVAVPPHTQGMFRVQAAEWLPSPLILPATVIALEPEGSSGLHALWLRFESLTPALEAALERHLFRVHRRAVAESRRVG